MKKLLLFVIALGLAGALGKVLLNTWQTTAVFRTEGREATLQVGKKYNTSRWAAPLPIKKIHIFTATMAEKYDVLIETDQELEEKKIYTIRFLLRDRATEIRQNSLRPLVSSIRLRAKEDGTPVTIQDTDLFERILTKAIGPLAPGSYTKARPVAETAPNLEVPSVPFLLVPADAPTWRIVWANGTVGEGLALFAWILLIQWLLTNASNQPWRPNAVKKSEKEGFIHPSMRHIEADAPTTAQKISYTPKPRKPGPLTPSVAGDQPATEPSRPAPHFPPPPSGNTTTPLKLPSDDVSFPPEPQVPTELPPPRKISLPFKPKTSEDPKPEAHSTATTAPFIPKEGGTQPNLKLRKKPTE